MLFLILTVAANPKWRTGTRAFRLTSSSTNSQTEGLVITSAETDYTAKGMIQQVQGTVVSTREPKYKEQLQLESTSIQVAVANRVISNSTSAIGYKITAAEAAGNNGAMIEVVIRLLKDSILIKKMDYL